MFCSLINNFQNMNSSVDNKIAAVLVLEKQHKLWNIFSVNNMERLSYY